MVEVNFAQYPSGAAGKMLPWLNTYQTQASGRSSFVTLHLQLSRGGTSALVGVVMSRTFQPFGQLISFP